MREPSSDELAFIDDLTGLRNRRFVNRLFSERWRDGESTEGVAAVLIDLDGFKQVNDTHGHAAGDAVLRSVASILRSSFRDSDIIARYGGDEFLVLLPSASVDIAAERARRARSAIEHDPAIPHRVSFSAGIASIPLDAATGDRLLALADARLYAEKKRRNRVPAVRRRFAYAAVAVLIAATAWTTARSRAPMLDGVVQAAPAPLRMRVAVLGFKNLSGRTEATWLSTAFREMLSNELAASDALRVIPGESVARTKVELQIPETDTLAPETLKRVHDTLGSDVVIVGSYLEVPEEKGSQIRLDVRMQDTRRGETIAVFSETGTDRELIPIVARTGAMLREKLGAPALGTAAIQTAQAAMPVSPEATRLYAEGLERLRGFDALTARQRLERAVAIDPASPLIHSALAEAWGILGYDHNARSAAQRAFELSSRLSREERLVVEGRYRETAREWNKAIAIYAKLFQFAPDSIDYGLALARSQRQAGRYREAQATLAKLRRLPAPANDDPRIDLVSAEASNDYRFTVTAARKAIAKAEQQGARLLVARARLLEAFALGELAEFVEATRAAKEAERIYEEAGDRGGLARAINRIATVRPDQAGHEETRALYQRSLAIAREIGDQRWTAQVLNNLALTYSNSGDLATAQPLFKEALAIFREIGFRRGEANVLLNTGRDLNSAGKAREARKPLNESLQIFRDLSDPSSVIYSLNNLGNSALYLGELDEATRLYAESLPICRDVGDKRLAAYTLLDQGDIFIARGMLAEGRSKHEEALAIREAIGVKLDAGDSRLALARLALLEGDAARAEREIRPVIDLFVAEKTIQNEAHARALLAEALFAQQKISDAERELRPALRLLPSMQHAYVRYAIRTVQARLNAARGKSADAERALNALIAEARRNGLVGEEYEARLALAEVLRRRRDDEDAAKVLADLEQDATSRGYGLIALRAAAQSATLRASA